MSRKLIKLTLDWNVSTGSPTLPSTLKQIKICVTLKFGLATISETYLVWDGSDSNLYNYSETLTDQPYEWSAWNSPNSTISVIFKTEAKFRYWYTYLYNSVESVISF